MEKPTVKVGDEVLIENFEKKIPVIYMDIISSVGRKYFYVEHLEKTKHRFLCDSGRHLVNTGLQWVSDSTYKAYRNMDEYKAKMALRRLTKQLQEYMNTSMKTPKQIASLAEEILVDKDAQTEQDLKTIKEWVE